jgi:hypothetical protein
MDHISKDPECVGDTAMKDLLEIVRTELLAIPLPERGSELEDPKFDEASGNTSAVPGIGDIDHSNVDVPPAELYAAHHHPSKQSRATVQRFRDSLDIIIDKGNRDNCSYWITGKPRDGLKGPRVSSIAAAPLYSEWRPILVDRRNDLFPTYELPSLVDQNVRITLLFTISQAYINILLYTFCFLYKTKV